MQDSAFMFVKHSFGTINEACLEDGDDENRPPEAFSIEQQLYTDSD